MVGRYDLLKQFSRVSSFDMFLILARMCASAVLVPRAVLVNVSTPHAPQEPSSSSMCILLSITSIQAHSTISDERGDGGAQAGGYFGVATGAVAFYVASAELTNEVYRRVCTLARSDCPMWINLHASEGGGIVRKGRAQRTCARMGRKRL